MSMRKYSRLEKEALECIDRKPSLCDSCGEVFVNRRNLAAHVKNCGVITADVQSSPPRIQLIDIKDEIDGIQTDPLSANDKDGSNSDMDHSRKIGVPREFSNSANCTSSQSSQSKTSTVSFASVAATNDDSTVVDVLCNKCGKPLLNGNNSASDTKASFLCRKCMFDSGYAHVNENQSYEVFISCCELCGKGLNENQGETSTVCNNCAKTSEAKKTVSLRKSGKIFPCEVCGKIFAQKSLLKQHMISHSEERPFCCDQCGKCFRRRYVLRHHMASHANVRPYICNTCGRSFIQKYQLSRHEARHTEERIFSCNHCCKSYGQRHELLRHMQTHKNPKPYVCNMCGKNFSRQLTLARHAQKHRGQNVDLPAGPHTCNVCSETFAVRSHLTKHKLMHHGGTASYTCDECGKVYRQQYSYFQHKLTHVQNKSFSCDTCGKAFSTEYSLKIHKIIHSNERPYACDKCNKTFKYKSSFKQHQTVHKTDKPFSCVHCGKAFTSKCLLKGHLVSHSKERPYCCEECGKTFIRRNHLREHRRTKHVSVSVFICEACNKLFRTRLLWKRHLVMHANCNAFPCKHCGNNFTSIGALRTHLLIHDIPDAKSFQCGMCEKCITYELNLKYPCLQEGKQEMLCCEDCRNKYGSKLNSFEHTESHYEEKTSQNEVKRETITPTDIEGTPLRTYSCQTCKTYFEHIKDYAAHALSHTRAKSVNLENTDYHHNYVPGACLNKQTASPPQKTPSTPKTYTCQFCKVVLSHVKDYTSHLMTHAIVIHVNSEGQKTYCSVTSGRDKGSQKATTPSKVSKPTKKYTCQLCKLVYTHEKDYTAHVLSHSKIIPSKDNKIIGTSLTKCTQCGASCSEIPVPQVLDVSPVHTGEKPFCSDECRNAFRYKNSYSRTKP